MKHIKTFEGFLNEAGPALGPKTKKFDSKIQEWDFFTDADGGEEPLPAEWRNALKELGITADSAIVCFYDAVGDAQEVLDAAKNAGLKYVEIEDSDAGSDGIVFSLKQ